MNSSEPNTGAHFTEFAEVDGIAVVRFYNLHSIGIGMGEIDGLEAELFSVADRNWLAVILDFEDKDFIPAAILEHVFVKLYRRLGLQLRMCNLPAMVTEHFRMNGLAAVFSVHSTLEDAMDAVKKAEANES